MEVFKNSLATLTGGSGAVAVLLTDGSYSAEKRRRVLGGVTQAAPEFHGLCRWGIEVMVWCANWVAGLPGAVGRVPAIPTHAFVLMIVGGLWCALWGTRWRLGFRVSRSCRFRR